MRRRILLAAAVAAATITALLTTASSASADGSTTITIGPGQYTGTFSHPTGTVSVGGGTISARCAASSFKGSALFQTPSCVTRVVGCPATASSCTMVINVRENALRGPVAVSATAVVYSGNYHDFVPIQPYNCPQPYSCGARVQWTLDPGTLLQMATFNIAFNPNFPSLFGQLTITVHS